MRIQISGDTLALDQAIRRQVEREAGALMARFPGESMDLRVRIAEELDQIHGHRVRCEVVIQAHGGRQWVVREARKDAAQSISESFRSARQNIRRTLRRSPSAHAGVAVAAAS